MSKSEMMQLSEVRDWLKTFGRFDHYYIGKLDSKFDKSLGIYKLQNGILPIVAIGGIANSSYNIKRASLLVHWTNNFRDTEKASCALYEDILNASDAKIGDWKVQFINMMENEPQDVGTDENGIYESVIDIEIYYERNN